MKETTAAVLIVLMLAMASVAITAISGFYNTQRTALVSGYSQVQALEYQQSKTVWVKPQLEIGR